MTIAAPHSRAAGAVLVAALWLSTGRAARAQLLPSTPLTFGGGRVVVSGSLSASIGPSDDRAYYNLTGYDTDLLRLVRVSLDASVRLTNRAEIVVGLDGLTPVDHWSWDGYPSSLHLAVRPWPQHGFVFRAGIVEPPFGAFLRKAYGRENLLIGFPLAYQYATTLRSDAFPSSTDDLLWLPGGRVSRRGLGAVARYAIGDAYRAPGLPLVNPFGWNPGVQVDAGNGALRGSIALLRGGLADRYHRDGEGDSGWSVAGRLDAHPTPGLALGMSAAFGGYTDLAWRPTLDTAVFNRTPRDTAIGFDAEYSRGYWLVRGEAILDRRTVPAFSAPYLQDALGTRWAMLEARYKLFPGLYLAARGERLSFSEVTGSKVSTSWDAPVTRVEAGGGYSLTKNVLGKVSYQRNRRESHWYPRQQLVSAQVVLWF